MQEPGLKVSESYREHEVASASQGRLIVMMYEGAIRFLNNALDGLQTRKLDRANDQLLRAQDVLGRLGNDEFVALLPGTAVERALRGAERITQRILTAAQAERLPPLTISVGVVKVLPNESFATVLERADSALYEAKRQGRGRAVLAEAGPDTSIFTESHTLGLTPD